MPNIMPNEDIVQNFKNIHLSPFNNSHKLFLTDSVKARIRIQINQW